MNKIVLLFFSFNVRLLITDLHPITTMSCYEDTGWVCFFLPLFLRLVYQARRCSMHRFLNE